MSALQASTTFLGQRLVMISMFTKCTRLNFDLAEVDAYTADMVNYLFMTRGIENNSDIIYKVYIQNYLHL